ncbi:type III helper protein HopAK1 [Pseudomonas viridiflava]|uniref:Type III helper protein HopAK1 n=1 Tax=Pseudomonas viridiflava TaxID=33069 RepID=A0A3M5PBY5_PSEVI|nr:type III helper protein HopAK1 [Pseudomonas viridiflava]RMT82014.1 Type III helper protein HopAK1 [Pseudomonas viridiflava]
MSIINRNYSPVSGSTLPALDSMPDSPARPKDSAAVHNGTMIDFGAFARVSASDSPSTSLHAGARTPEIQPYASSPQGENGELTLNKLVEAIRGILEKLFSLLRGNPQEQQPSTAQPQSENPTRTGPSSTSPTFSPTSLSKSPSATQTPDAHSDPSPGKSGASPRAATPPVAAEMSNTQSLKTPPQKEDVKPSPVSDPELLKTELLKTKPSGVDHRDAQTPTPEKTQGRAPVGQGHDLGADMSGMVGFAKAAKTTGGNGGEVVTVNTVEELQKSMADDKARTVRLGADLSADSKVTVKFGANKTLLGTDKGNGLHNIYMVSDKSGGNDIFQNLDFTHDSRYRENGDMQMFISNGERYWLDHNTFTGTKKENPTGLDKLLYVGGTADNVSLTNSKFQNNEYGVILGQPDDSPTAKAQYQGYPRMTIANNAFNDLTVRAPGLMRHGDFDVYNNYIDNFHLGFTATGDAHILSQANYFEKGVDVRNKSSAQGVLDDYGDAHFKDVGSNVSFTQKSPVTVWSPQYQREIKTAEAAKAYDLVNAGANP